MTGPRSSSSRRRRTHLKIRNWHFKTKNFNIVFASPLISRWSCFSGNGPLGTVWGRLVAYCSKQAHSSVERAGMLAGVTMHQIHTDDLCRSNTNLLSLCVFILLPTFSCAVLFSFSLPACLFDSLPACLSDYLPACWSYSLRACSSDCLKACSSYYLPACSSESLPACSSISLPPCSSDSDSLQACSSNSLPAACSSDSLQA